jgi:uncharacterized hydrophobic protein (TIGR00271 family)
MQAAADGIRLHADADEVVGTEEVEGVGFGQGHTYLPFYGLVDGASKRAPENAFLSRFEDNRAFSGFMTVESSRMKNLLQRYRPEFKPLDEIYASLNEGRQFDSTYALMLVLSCLIALLGLLVNSPAVIIGAMLISPLMGPILACGLALTLAEWELGTKAGRNVALSIVEAVVIAAVATFFSPLREATPEILARGNPNLMDLLIAFFSGVAGVLALTSGKAGMTIIPGVAIATAVMPPLATTGYGLATGQWEIARGAFLLFFTNLTAIVISADLVFLLVGFRPAHEMLRHRHRLLVGQRIGISLVILAVVSIPLVRTLLDAAQQARVRREISVTLRERLEQPGHARLSSVDFRLSESLVTIDAFARTTRFISFQEVKALEQTLAQRLERPVKFRLEQVRVEENGPEPARSDFLAGSALQPVATPSPPKPAVAALWEIQERVQTELAETLVPMRVVGVTVAAIGRNAPNLMRVEFTARQSSPTAPEAWAVVAASLADKLDSAVELRGTVVTARQPENCANFPPGSARAAPNELKKVRELLTAAGERTDLRAVAAGPPSGNEDMVRRRTEFLRGHFPQLTGAAEPDPGAEADQVSVFLLQSVSVRGEPAPPSEPAETGMAAPN